MRQVSYLNKAFSAQARIIPHLPENHVGRYAEKPQYKRFQTSLVCPQKKSCLQCKEALFATQTRLLLKRIKTGAGAAYPTTHLLPGRKEMILVVR